MGERECWVVVALRGCGLFGVGVAALKGCSGERGLHGTCAGVAGSGAEVHPSRSLRVCGSQRVVRSEDSRHLLLLPSLSSVSFPPCPRTLLFCFHV